MRSIASTMLALAFTAFLCACGDDSSSNSSDEGNFDGSYGEFSVVSDEEASLFEKVVEDFKEYKLFDPESVSTQLVAGTNYKFLCSMETDDGDVKVYVTIYQPLPNSGKETQITLIVKVDSEDEPVYQNMPEVDEDDESSSSKKIDNTSSSSEEGGLDIGVSGGYGKFAKISDGDAALFEEVVKAFNKYELFDPESVSTQMVSGKNYKFLCSMNQGGSDVKVYVVIYQPLSSSGKDPEITSIDKVDAKAGEYIYDKGLDNPEYACLATYTTGDMRCITGSVGELTCGMKSSSLTSTEKVSVCPEEGVTLKCRNDTGDGAFYHYKEGVTCNSF